MDYNAVLAQVLALLQQKQRVAYRVLKRQFQLDDEIARRPQGRSHLCQKAGRGQGPAASWSGPVRQGPRRWLPQCPHPSLTRHPILRRRSSPCGCALEGERKHVTVLFADLKDSTTSIRGLDPEAAQQLLDPALQRMMDAVHRFEGTVNQVPGRWHYGLFGAPIAHEDHALRACYAALAMQLTFRTPRWR